MWWCCGPCSAAKLCSYVADQQCAWVNHCLPACCCGLCTGTILRHNLRAKYGIGPAPTDQMGWVGDCLITCCCGCCSACQILRGVPPESWDFVAQLQGEGVATMVEPPYVIIGMEAKAPLMDSQSGPPAGGAPASGGQA
eukprot:TRINITY_DN3206_c0_g1_i2.p2 TRINITY_DN3206_c0_g1~~TRINITY_DN3206_c0_g1_i2.p2  ORF type:complete len:139 (+),score=20.21 TRINITY_DN3206_c0_g1_i2:654-1070(+)